MSEFSWMTADTVEPVLVHVERTVYLLQPDAAPIAEPFYTGHGRFGDTDAFAWLAKKNLIGAELVLDENKLVSAGISLDSGFFVHDVRSKKNYSIFHEPPFGLPFPVDHLRYRYCDHVDILAGNPNDLMKSGLLISYPYPKRFPLKLSYNPLARYDDLPPSIGARQEDI